MFQQRIRAIIPVLLFSVACSEAPVAKKKAPEKPPEPISARHAFQNMFAAARTWAPDAQVVQLQSYPIADVKEKDGLYGAWVASFASPSRMKLKTWSYSVVEAGGNFHKGVFAGHEESFSGTRGQAKPFLAAALRIDSDEAFQTASKKATDYMAKHPDMRISYLLELTPRFPDPAWRIMWGESVSSSTYSVFVDATTGLFLTTVR
ncbi:MAG: hypothetical protein HYZ37_06800 [Candidatus Solibacter usitatus]|nr:hypothetical protein [Candidatus Solibacter usitatus]